MRQADAPLAEELLSTLLEAGKVESQRKIYARLEPDQDGVIRSFMAPTAETGRCRHSGSFLDPSTNLANLSKKTALLNPLFRVRQTIIPHPGRLLGKADYAQAEARWCAWLANDPDRIEMFESGIDQYRFFVAMLKWEDASEENMARVTKPERNSIGKVGILSGQYKATWRTHLDNVNGDYDLHGHAIDARTARRMEALFPELFPRTAIWWQEVAEQALTHGYITNPFGYKRTLYGRTDSPSARDAVVREAIAAGPQSCNGIMLNMALQKLYEAHDPELVRILLQVHDEIVFDCREEDGQEAARAVRNTMEFPVQVETRELVVPAEVSLSRLNWDEMEEVEA